MDAPEVSREHFSKAGYTYPFLSDSKSEVIRAYDLLHEGGGPGAADIARPAEFLVDATGTVRWVNLTESITVRLRPGQVLKVIDDLGLGS